MLLEGGSPPILIGLIGCKYLHFDIFKRLFENKNHFCLFKKYEYEGSSSGEFECYIRLDADLMFLELHTSIDKAMQILLNGLHCIIMQYIVRELLFLSIFE